VRKDTEIDPARGGLDSTAVWPVYLQTEAKLGGGFNRRPFVLYNGPRRGGGSSSDQAGDQEDHHGEAEAHDQGTRGREDLHPAHRNGNHERLTTTTLGTPLPAFGARSGDGWLPRARARLSAMPRALRQAPMAQRF
jgi:hypothetical protein